MSESYALYVLEECTKSIDAILTDIRSADIIDETNSGEGPREECSLYTMIDIPTSEKFSSFEAVLEDIQKRSKDNSGEKHWDSNFLVVAGKEANHDPSVVIFYELKDGKVEHQLKCLAKNVLDPMCNLPIANMDIEEFEGACNEDGVFAGFR